MLKNKLLYLMPFLFLGFFSLCFSQKNMQPMKTTDRNPAVAGTFYSSDKSTLEDTLKSLFDKAKPKSTDNVFALISPHAGYIYSGQVAASAFNQLDSSAVYNTIFIIGASHRFSFNGASVYSKGNFITPLGTVEVDATLANTLIQTDTLFQFDQDYHVPEHCIEVQLPFLQYKLKNKFKIVPILIGTDNEDVLKKIAAQLKPYFNSNNLFVISTDFSHYPAYADALIADKKTSDAILKNSSAELIKAINENINKKISGLQTSLCGYSAVLPLVYITEKMDSIGIKNIQYKNSGDVSGDNTAVVGYNAIAFYSEKKSEKSDKSNEFLLSTADKKKLIEIARTTLDTFIITGNIPIIDTTGFSKELKTKSGAFVTLKIKDELRGCIGLLVSEEPLYKIIQQMTISSSTRDYRFAPVTEDEIDEIDIEISVLSPMKKIDSTDEIVLGKHGIYIKKGSAAGTFLPQVASETGWTLEEFLGHCSRDKAGIGWEGWKDADIYIYTAIVFGEEK